MSSLSSFLARKAELFSEGQLQAACANHAVPTTVYIGGQKLFAGDLCSLGTALANYRANLLVEGYAKTEVEILHQCQSPDRGVRALLVWRHFTRTGALLREAEASYFFDRDANGRWVVTLAEFLRDPPARLMSGIPVH